jgi:dTDP-4-amino-4,6-dideoxygalactose transaminase
MTNYKKVTKTQAIRAAKKLGVNLDVIDIDILKKGINVELEHGKRHGKTNVTNDSITLSLTIALAHLEEFPNSERIMAEGFLLGSHHGMTVEDCDYVCDKIKEFFKKK